ncbi:MAG TPA: DUF5698 domain-containing protein [Gemmatimonadales bacterium]
MFDAFPIWLIACLIFSLRVVDVSLGTIRTLSVVGGHIRISVLLGIIEVSVWVLAISQVVQSVSTHPWLVLAYSGGFGTGSAVGILLERRLAIGTCVVRIISRQDPAGLETALRPLATGLTTFIGSAEDGHRTLLYLSCRRRDLPQLLRRARAVDPALFYVVERFSQIGGSLGVLPHETGWRTLVKMK